MLNSTITENAPFGIFVVDKNDNFIQFNSAMESISGLKASDVIGTNLLKDIPDQTLEGEGNFKQLFLNTKSSLKKTHRKEMPIINPVGELSYQTITLLPLIADNGSYDGMIVYVEEVSEGHRREESLLDELQHAREMNSIYADIPVIFFRWSAKEGWPVEFVSDNISQLGYKKEDFISGSLQFRDIMHPDDVERIKEHTKNLEASNYRYHYNEFRILNKECNPVWVDEISVLKLDADGLPSHYDGMIINVTDRVKAESSLAKEREYLNDITSNLEIGLCIISSEYRTLWANDHLKKVFGDVEGELCYKINNKKSAICDKDAVQQILGTSKNKAVTDQSGFDVNGNLIWSHIISTPLRDDEGNVSSVMQVVFPINEMKATEMELRENKARLESVLKAAPVGMGVVSGGRVFEEVNDRLCEMLGYSKEELLGQSIRMIYPSDEVFDYIGDVYYSQMRESGIGEMDIQVVTKDGRTLDIFLSSSPIHPEFFSRGITFTMLDITSMKEAERELQKYALELEKANRLKDLFSDIIHHDLLSPAGLVKGYAEILEEMEDDERKLHILNMLESNNNRLIELIESASKYEKLKSIDEIDFHKADLVDIFKDVVGDLTPLIKGKGLDITVSSKGPCASCVNTLVSEAFFNILSNAIKYSPENEKIDIDFLDAGGFWNVKVTDRGEGVSDKNKVLIFERFKRVDKKGVKGTGLGLAIVKRIMDLHGGDYGVEDNPEGRGSVFWLSLKKC
ncbi:PAS domain S-box protein [Methanolobus sp. ZRKC3]|uniref:PAS domain S-box protein n=1 Tax=Methanolobus sp. ZRKC3 TaxID=3125786 RepID=UPI003243F734